MKLNDILPIDKWIALEKDLHNRYGLDVNVFDTSGVRISDFKEWVNGLCPAIKATDKGQSFICAVAHMNIAAQAMQTHRPAIEECDAGLVKIVVPIFMDDMFLGAVGACGLLLDEGEVDTFLIDKITDIDEKTALELAAGVGTISSAGAASLAEDVTRQIAAIVTAYKNKHQS